MPPVLTNDVWTLHPLVRLTWRKLDDVWVVFDSGSGNTHQLPALDAAVLMCLEEQPSSGTLLLEALRELVDAERAYELDRVLAKVLAQLRTLELTTCDRDPAA